MENDEHKAPQKPEQLAERIGKIQQRLDQIAPIIQRLDAANAPQAIGFARQRRIRYIWFGFGRNMCANVG